MTRKASPPAATAGLCETCRHRREVFGARGSRFVLCERSRGDARYARYPRIPVYRCPGFVADSNAPEDEAGGDLAPRAGTEIA